MGGLGLTAGLDQLHEGPDHQAGGEGDGAGGGLHLGVELPRGSVFWKRERYRVITYKHTELEHSGVVLCLFIFHHFLSLGRLSLFLFIIIGFIKLNHQECHNFHTIYAKNKILN